jgi:mRNA-degrading endonuclease toxin of MazEF toxin-antitoxin module
VGALRQGLIVLADVPGAQHNPRPVVIIKPPSGSDPKDTVFVTGISSIVDNPPSAHHVLLPYHPKGHPRTGLSKRCAAKCDWSFAIEQQRIVGVKGYVPVAYMKSILEQLTLLGQLPQP